MLICMRRLGIIIILRNTQFFHRLLTIVVENYHLTVEKVKLNVYECCNQCLKCVINTLLNGLLNVISYSHLGEQSNRISPKCQGDCYKTSETFAFSNIQHFIHNNT